MPPAALAKSEDKAGCKLEIEEVSLAQTEAPDDTRLLADPAYAKELIKIFTKFGI